MNESKKNKYSWNHEVPSYSPEPLTDGERTHARTAAIRVSNAGSLSALYDICDDSVPSVSTDDFSDAKFELNSPRFYCICAQITYDWIDAAYILHRDAEGKKRTFFVRNVQVNRKHELPALLLPSNEWTKKEWSNDNKVKTLGRCGDDFSLGHPAWYAYNEFAHKHHCCRICVRWRRSTSIRPHDAWIKLLRCSPYAACAK